MGESLGEHGENGHGFFVYDSTQRVPWFMSGPGIPKQVVDTPVSLVDVMPTILDTLDLPIPASVDGRVAPHNQPVYMEAFMLQDRLGLAPHFGLVKGNEKLIDVPRPELYRLDVDPNEQSDLASDQMESVVSLKQTIDGFGLRQEIRPRRFRWIRRLRNSLKHSAMSSLRASGTGYCAGRCQRSSRSYYVVPGVRTAASTEVV